MKVLQNILSTNKIAHFSSERISYEAKRKKLCEMADLVLQCRGPVGLGQEQEFPVQTPSLLEETVEPAPQKSTLFTATKENLHNRHTQPWKYEYFKCVFFLEYTVLLFP
ncbi:hypothetical protein AV530_006330 [Patagioenas fasciata monilis]|uniref:Uncharacterized protein n=1 Tax=Patagioenas fasciata monilis TaxID=372326 RepID=A0A1V4KG80_PATFA|nr:hypothetical protein AV530_006330 [Patagioenas fasciata monilis]